MSEQHSQQRDNALTSEQLESEQARLKSLLLDHYHCTFFLPIVNDSKNPFPTEPRGDYRHTYQDTESDSESNSGRLSDNEKVRLADAQAYHFFTPTIRSIMFDQGESNSQGLEPMKEWRLPKNLIKDWTMTLYKNSWAKGEETDPLNQQQVGFESVRLYRYFNNNYILAFRVMPKALQELHKVRDDEVIRLSQLSEHKTETVDELIKQANKNLGLFSEENNKRPSTQTLRGFKDDPLRDKYEDLQLEAWLRFSRLARQLYPSFTEQGEEGKIAPLSLSKVEVDEPIYSFDKQMKPNFPKAIGEQLSPVVREILLSFFAEKDQKAVKEWLSDSLKLYDDRMFISVAYSLAGAQHDQRTLNIINALTGTTDRVGDVWGDFDNLPYSPSALQEYLEGSRFEFWEEIGGTYTFTDMVNAYVYRGSFFRDVIAPVHIPAIYDRMLVQALFYQTSLRSYNHAITDKTTELLSGKGSKKNTKDIENLLGEFIRFTNQYWFAEITNQMQGKVIFDRQLKGLNVDQHFALLQDEIDRTNAYVHAEFEQRQNEKADNLNKFAILIAIIALLPVFNDIFKAESSMWSSLATMLGEPAVSGASSGSTFTLIRCSIAAVVGLLPFLVWFVLAGIARIRSCRQKCQPSKKTKHFK